MRFFSIFMSGYLLALCAFPCGDVKECKETTIHEVLYTQDHKEHDHQQEACTPFCYCACCAVSVIYQPVSAVNSPAAVDERLHFLFKVSLYSSDFQSFWQPPKWV